MCPLLGVTARSVLRLRPFKAMLCLLRAPACTLQAGKRAHARIAELWFLFFVHAQPGWFGFDCSRSKAYGPPKTNALANKSNKLKIYMYELPASLAVDIVYSLPSHSLMYDAYIHFFEAFMQGERIITFRRPIVQSRSILC